MLREICQTQSIASLESPKFPDDDGPVNAVLVAWPKFLTLSGVLRGMRRLHLLFTSGSRRRLPAPTPRNSSIAPRHLRRRTTAPLNGAARAEFISKLGTVVEEIDEAVRWLEHMRDVKIALDPELFSEAEQLRRIWGASLGTARRNEKARQQRLKERAANRRRRGSDQ